MEGSYGKNYSSQSFKIKTNGTRDVGKPQKKFAIIKLTKEIAIIRGKSFKNKIN